MGKLLIPQIETFTAITAISIGGTLTVYVWFLKRNGWIGGGAPSSILVQPTGKSELSLSMEELIAQRRENSLEDSSSILSEKETSEISGEGEKPSDVDEVHPLAQTVETVDPLVEEKRLYLRQKMAEAQRLAEAQKSVKEKDRRSGCIHHFGYLRLLPRGTETPGECILCPKLIECYKER